MKFPLAVMGVVLLLAVRAAAGVEVAVLHLGRLIEAHPRVEADRAVLEKQLDEYEAERKQMVGELKEMKEAFEAILKGSRNEALSEEARAAKRDEAEKKLRDITEFQRTIRATLA